MIPIGYRVFETGRQPFPIGDLRPRVARIELMNRLPTLAIGTVASLIAMSSLVFIVTNTGPQFDAVIIDDHVVGGTSDRLTAWVIGSVSAAVAVTCAIRLRRLD